MAVALSTLVEEADRYLNSAKIADYCPNGLQVEGRPQVMRIVSGVTASQALLESEFAASDSIDHHSGGIRRVPYFELEVQFQRDVAERLALHFDVAPLPVFQPWHMVTRADVDVLFAKIVVEL